MKYFSFLLLIVSSMSFSQVANLNYFLEDDDFLVQARWDNNEFEKEPSSGRKSGNTEIRLEASVLYGYTDSFSFGLGWGYRNKEDDQNGYENNGIVDFSFLGKFRLYQLNGWIFDIEGDFSPSLGESKFATQSTNGNGFRGASSLNSSIIAYKSLDLVDLKLFTGFDYVSSGKSVSAANSNVEVDFKSQLNLNLGVFLQYRHPKNFLLNGGFALNLIGDEELPKSQVKTEYDFGTTFRFGVGYEHNKNQVFSLNIETKSRSGEIISLATSSKSFDVDETNSSLIFDYQLTF